MCCISAENLDLFSQCFPCRYQKATSRCILNKSSAWPHKCSSPFHGPSWWIFAGLSEVHYFSCIAGPQTIAVFQVWSSSCFCFLSPLAGFLLIPCSFLLGFIAARVQCSSIFRLLPTSVEVQAVLPVVLKSVPVPDIFLAKVQVFALVEFHEIPASEYFHLTRWSCPQVYQSFPPKLNVIFKTDKDGFCLHLLLLRENIRHII